MALWCSSMIGHLQQSELGLSRLALCHAEACAYAAGAKPEIKQPLQLRVEVNTSSTVTAAPSKEAPQSKGAAVFLMHPDGASLHMPSMAALCAHARRTVRLCWRSEIAFPFMTPLIQSVHHSARPCQREQGQTQSKNCRQCGGNPCSGCWRRRQVWRRGDTAAEAGQPWRISGRHPLRRASIQVQPIPSCSAGLVHCLLPICSRLATVVGEDLQPSAAAGSRWYMQH